MRSQVAPAGVPSVWLPAPSREASVAPKVSVRLLGMAPIAATDVLAVQPEFADLAVRQLGTGGRVDDHGPLAAGHLTARHHRNAVAGVRGDGHGAADGEMLRVEADDTRSGIGCDGRDEQGGLRDAVGRFECRGRQTVWLERGGEGRHRIEAHRLGTDDHHHVAQVDVLPGGGQAALGCPLVGEIRCRGDHPANPRAGRQCLNPALWPANERRRRQQRGVAAVDGGEADHRQTHVVVER